MATWFGIPTNNKDSSCNSRSLSAFGDISGPGFDHNNSDGVAPHCFHPVDLIYSNAYSSPKCPVCWALWLAYHYFECKFLMQMQPISRQFLSQGLIWTSFLRLKTGFWPVGCPAPPSHFKLPFWRPCEGAGWDEGKLWSLPEISWPLNGRASLISR